MSNWKHAYGWVGHIITSAAENESDARDNVVAIPRLTWERLVGDYERDELDERIEARQLGVESAGVYFLAVGYAFSEGFRHYGTVFAEAEALEGGGNDPTKDEASRDYMAAMLEIYGVALPPAKLMVGCLSEH